MDGRYVCDWSDLCYHLPILRFNSFTRIWYRVAKSADQKINTFSHNELNHFGTDTLITRMTNDINQLQLALAMVIRLLIRAPFLSIGSVVMAFVIDWEVGLFFLALLPIFSIILFFIIRKNCSSLSKSARKTRPAQ